MQLDSKKHEGLAIFTGNAHPELARNVVHELGNVLGKETVLGQSEIGTFRDGEASVRLIDDPRGLDVFIIQPTGQPDRNQTELELMAMAARSAWRITAVIPYFGYARQDRRDQPRVPISVVRAVRNLIDSGIDRVLLLDLHAGQIVGVFEAVNQNIIVDHLYARPVILDWLSEQDLTNVTVSSVDVGGAKMVESYWDRLRRMGHPVEFGIAHKSGSSSIGIGGVQLLGRFENRRTIFLDDMITSGDSADKAARKARELGATEITVIAIHPVLADIEVCRKIMESPINRFVTTDTLPIREEYQQILVSKLVQVSVARLLALAIKRLHNDESISVLFELDGYRAG